MDTQEKTMGWMEVAEVKISYYPNVKACNRPKIVSSKTAFELLRDRWDEDTLEFVESFKVILLNRASLVLGVSLIGIGGRSSAVVDQKLVFIIAPKADCQQSDFGAQSPIRRCQPFRTG